MGDVDGESEGLGRGAKIRLKVRLLARCTGRIGLRLQLGSGFNVRVIARLSFNVMVRCG